MSPPGDLKELVRGYLGLGGNIGDVISTMAGALRRLDHDPDIEVVAVSPVYRSPPWGFSEQEWFHNCCAAVETRLSAEALLEVCMQVEKHFQRERRLRWGPRTLDIDILLLGDETREDELLCLPHPRIRDRVFVLHPLCDIAPELVLFDQTPGQWLARLDDSELERINLQDDWWQSG